MMALGRSNGNAQMRLYSRSGPIRTFWRHYSQLCGTLRPWTVLPGVQRTMSHVPASPSSSQSPRSGSPGLKQKSNRTNLLSSHMSKGPRSRPAPTAALGTLVPISTTVPLYQGWTPDRGIRFASSSQPLSSSGSVQEVEDKGLAPYHALSSPEVSSADHEEYFSCQESAPASPHDSSGEEPGGTLPMAPLSSLPFNIPNDLFLQAKASPLYSEGSYWSYSLYRGPPNAEGQPKKVSVHYCRSRHTMDRVIKNYFLGEPVIGLDLEWVAESSRYDGVRKNVSLIQLANPSRIALFHVALFDEHDDNLASPTLRLIMEDDQVLKCGVGIKADCTRLRTYMHIDAKGVLELSNLYKVVKYTPTGEYNLINKKLVRLADQVEEHLKLPLFKGKVRTGNWSEPLTMPQIIYSASDAYAGLHLYQIYEDARLSMTPMPPRPHFAELGLPIPLLEVPPKKTKRIRKASATTNDVEIATAKEDCKPDVEGDVLSSSQTELDSPSFGVTEEVAIREAMTSEVFSNEIIGQEETIPTPLSAPEIYNNFESSHEDTYQEVELSSQDLQEVAQQEPINDDEPIIEDKDINLELLSKVFDISKLVEALKDSVKFEVDEEARATFDESQRKEILDEAKAFAQTYREEHDSDFKLPFLRAYYLWHHQGFMPEEVAKILRDPPLAVSTVSGYIMEAIKPGNLPHDKQRLKKEVIESLSAWHRHVRYKGFLPPEVFELDKESVMMKGVVLRRALERALKMLPPEEERPDDQKSLEAFLSSKSAEISRTNDVKSQQQTVELSGMTEDHSYEDPIPPSKEIGSEAQSHEHEAHEADLMPGNILHMDEFSHLYVDDAPLYHEREQSQREEEENKGTKDENQKGTGQNSNDGEKDFICYDQIRPME